MRRTPETSVPSPVTVLMPGPEAGEWILLRRPAGSMPAPTPAAASSYDGTPAAAQSMPSDGATRQTFASLEAAAVNLLPEEEFHLDLPLDYGLVQRFALPPVEPDELEEMVRIQLEKILPYQIEDVGIVIQTIRRNENEVVVSVQAAHYDRLLSLCQPLTTHGRWPLRVNLHAVSIATGAAPDENSAFLYRAAGKVVLGICEEGRMSYAQILGGHTAEDVASELPGVLLGVELEGVPTAFQFLRLDERCAGWLPVIQDALGVPVELFRAEPAPAMAAGLNMPVQRDLSPASWQMERQRVLRRARLQRNVLLGVGIYLGLLLLAFVVVGVMKFQVHRLESRLRTTTPIVEKIKAADARWKTLAPAIDPSRSVAGTFEQVFECLPPGDTVRLTLFDQKLDTIEIRGEALNQAALDFTEKIKNRPQLRGYSFQATPPVILSNGKAQFAITGTHR